MMCVHICTHVWCLCLWMCASQDFLMISPLEKNVIFSYLWVLKAKFSPTSDPLQCEQSQKICGGWILELTTFLLTLNYSVLGAVSCSLKSQPSHSHHVSLVSIPEFIFWFQPAHLAGSLYLDTDSFLSHTLHVIFP